MNKTTTGLMAAKRVAVAVATVCVTLAAPAYATDDVKNVLDLMLKKGVISQEKADGMYCTINKSNGDIAMMSRSGKPFDTDSFPGIVEAAKKMLNDNTQTQGELLVINAAGEVQPREIGNGMLNKIAQGGVWPVGFSPIYHAWDQIPLSVVKTKVKYNVGYLARLTALEAQLGEHSQAIAVIDTRIVHSIDEAKAHYREMLEAGKEGTILSEPNAPWVDSTSKFKIKFKIQFKIKFKIKFKIEIMYQ
jgi:DNA ligase-1